MSAGLGTVTPEQTYLDIGAGQPGLQLALRPRICRRAEAAAPAGLVRRRRWNGPNRRRTKSNRACWSNGWKAEASRLGAGASACPLGIMPSGGGLRRLAPGSQARPALGDRSLARRSRRRSLAAPARSDLVIAISDPDRQDRRADPDRHRRQGLRRRPHLRHAPAPTATCSRPTSRRRSSNSSASRSRSQMSGQAIRTEGSVDPAAIETRGARMAVVSHRRGPVIGFSCSPGCSRRCSSSCCSRGALAPLGVRLLGLSVVYLPVLLLVGAALEPAEYPEMLLVMIGAPLLAALTLAALRDYRALAVASALTVGAYALDAIARLAAQRALAARPEPRPRRPLLRDRQRARGAALGRDRRRHRRRPGGLRAAPLAGPLRPSPSSSSASSSPAIFASGKFGADVGAAIDFPVGVAGAAALVITGGRRRWILLVIAASRSSSSPCWRSPTSSPAPTPTSPARCSTPAACTRSATSPSAGSQLSARSFVRPILLVGAAAGRDRGPRRHLAARHRWRAGSATSRPCARP